ncbi:SLAP domain-containing protein [Lacticaseibacillus zhaodongensis]|uniref:SLAP domain-containing protein n=1 Tax=Lacticaseibacillus zhaodongensis TaxID=2668065 RepID=UPI0012D31688|nr:SLAP domain-containing protein [Lacticaseibacillus zhaodongensis]
MKVKTIALSVLVGVSMLGGTVTAQAQNSAVAVQAATTLGSRYIGNKSGTAIHSTPNGALTGRKLNYGTAWKIFNMVTIAGKSWSSVGTNQWVLTSDLCLTKPVKTYYIDYVPGYGVKVYNAPAGKATGKNLKHGTAWNASAIKTVNGADWIQVGKTQWIQVSYTSTVKPASRYVVYKSGYSVTTYNAPGGKSINKPIKHGSKITVFQSVKKNGLAWTNIGHNRWIQSKYLSTKNPVYTILGHETTGVTYRMNATAYDPRVLGNYTFGYDTVAANLSRFRRGTKLAITFASGQTKLYVVRDTGGFAYSHPNQLDIAMPNSQALRFGRQNITVRVLK